MPAHSLTHAHSRLTTHDFRNTGYKHILVLNNVQIKPLAELFPSYYFVFSVNKTEKVQWRRRGAEDAGAKENMHG
jgi:hypothetical protein